MDGIDIVRAQGEAPPPEPKYPWRLVYYRKHKRHEKLFRTLDAGVKATLLCRSEGYDANLISTVRTFEPRGEAEFPDQWWCPYCRMWDWFVVPSERMNRGVYNHLDIRVHLWCGISQDDYWVRRYNFLDQNERRRRRRGRKTRRRRR